ncbi:hypothetical protein ACVBEE_00535 [Acinetobacter sp. ANC 3781]|uniref:hypothetical protein n=1 Tax=Acinetobacter TaxID=469 RepID=UPI0010396C18|nr:hypothetical protein [Acinetobacter sp. ANC 3781]TCB80155.1 hypothetical protein E0H89_00555 [Acinetobacter sp. ANC 3781]
MCGKPKTVEQDPEGDAQRAAEKATAEANTKKAMRRTSAGSMSVLGAQPDISKTKSTLGGG